MNRRNFIGAALALTAMPPLPTSPTKKKRTILQSPKAIAEGTVTPMVKLTASSPSSVNLQVLPGQFGITSVTKVGSNVTLTWQNGTGPFQVQHRSTITGSWLPIGPRTTLRSITFFDSAGFDTFRVQAFVGSASAIQNANGTVRLTWSLPQV